MLLRFNRHPRVLFHAAQTEQIPSKGLYSTRLRVFVWASFRWLP